MLQCYFCCDYGLLSWSFENNPLKQILHSRVTNPDVSGKTWSRTLGTKVVLSLLRRIIFSSLILLQFLNSIASKPSNVPESLVCSNKYLPSE